MRLVSALPLIGPQVVCRTILLLPSENDRQVPVVSGLRLLFLHVSRDMSDESG
jgi:hypothetical protein